MIHHLPGLSPRVNDSSDGSVVGTMPAKIGMNLIGRGTVTRIHGSLLIMTGVVGPKGGRGFKSPSVLWSEARRHGFPENVKVG